MLNHRKKKLKQDPIPKKKSLPGSLSLSTSFLSCFSVLLMVQDGSVKEAP